MPLTYQQFVENRNRNPEEFNRNILPQMDLLEAALRETVRTLNNTQPKDAARIKEFNAMADAIHTVCHPGTLTWESTKNAAMQRFGTLRDFLEKEDGKNYELLEATMKKHPELLADLPQAEQSKPMMERYRDLSVYFGLNYSADYTRRFNKLHRERFLANRDKDLTGFRNYTAKQIDYVSAVFRQLAQELEDERGDYRQIRALRQMAEHLTVLKADGDKVPAQEIENALEKLRGLSVLLEDHEGELALRLHSAAGNNPKLLELLPDSPALRKMPVLQHLTEIIPVLSLELTNGLQQLAAQENMLVTEEQEQLAQQQEEAARLADLQAEEEDAQEELRQNLAQGLNQGPQPVNQPSGKRVVIQGNPLHGKLRDAVEEIFANPALKGAAVDVIMTDRVPGPASDHVEEQILPPQNTARSEMHSASWWIKKLRSAENLYKQNPKTGTKELDVTKLAGIMAARDLANSVRGEKANLVNKNLSLGQIRARAAELANQPDFNNFILKIRSDPELQRKAISAVGDGHGGGLDDLFSEYLARKAPGELPVSPELKRWAPSALQRIEGLQEQLRQGDLDEFQTKKRLAEIIAARKLVGARRAGTFHHADERLNKKLTEPKKLNAKAGDLETCLNMLTSDQIQNLARMAKDGHGGAMLEHFKTMNTVKLHMAEINHGLAFNPKYKVDAALAMAIYKENAQNSEAQLDDTKAMRTAAALRKLPFYQEFQGREETNDKLKQNVDIGGLYNDYVQLKEQHLQNNKEQDARPLNELLDEREPQRSSTLDSVLNRK